MGFKGYLKLLLFGRCILLLALGVGVLCWVLICGVVLGVFPSWFSNHLAEEERAGCFSLIVLCPCSASLPQCVVGWSASVID